MGLVDAETGDGCGLPGPFCLLEEQIIEDKDVNLRTELERVQAQIASLQSALDDKPDYGLGEGAPAVTRRELDHVLLEQIKERAAGIELALSAMAKNAYDVCEECGWQIQPDRLAILPDARTCIRCAKKRESE